MKFIPRVLAWLRRHGFAVDVVDNDVAVNELRGAPVAPVYVVVALMRDPGGVQ
ncbi:MAG: hypothetical protein ACK52I_01755 [Pseudomonadota bacterium]|jgi:hypothetical protein